MSGAPTIEQPLLPERVQNTRALWTVLVIMALLAACALLFARGATRLSSNWDAQLSGTASVQVLPTNAETRAAEIELARSLIEARLPDASVGVISDDRARALLDPWLGDAALPDDLGVPAIIEITQDVGATALNVTALSAALEEQGLDVRVDDHARYGKRLRATARRLVTIGSTLLILVLIAATSVNIFATRAGLSAQREIIRVLVQVGATDRFIAKLFIGQAGRRGLFGALVGCALAGLIWFVVTITGGQDDWGGIGWPGVLAALSDVLWLIGLCAVFALICAGAAGFTAQRQLADERKRL